MLPAVPPVTSPLAVTVPPPDTSITDPVPSTTPPWPCTVTLPPAADTAVTLPSRRWLAKLPERSMRAPVARSTRPTASKLTVPPALRTPLLTRNAPALVAKPAARVKVARSGSSSAAPASVTRVSLVASVMRPKPPSCSVPDATRDVAVSAAVKGSAQSAGSAAPEVGRSVSAVSTPVPRKAAVPKFPPLVTLPRLKRADGATASRPLS